MRALLQILLLEKKGKIVGVRSLKISTFVGHLKLLHEHIPHCPLEMLALKCFVSPLYQALLKEASCCMNRHHTKKESTQNILAYTLGLTSRQLLVQYQSAT